MRAGQSANAQFWDEVITAGLVDQRIFDTDTYVFDT